MCIKKIKVIKENKYKEKEVKRKVGTKLKVEEWKIIIVASTLHLDTSQSLTTKMRTIETKVQVKCWMNKKEKPSFKEKQKCYQAFKSQKQKNKN